MRALVIGASGGIGSALVKRLEACGHAVTGLSRREDGFDVTDEAIVQRGLSELRPPYETILVATGALELRGCAPEKSLRALDPGALAAHFALNAAGPALVLKHALRLMPRDRRAVFAALSARVGSIGDNRLGGWYSYRAAKAALNQLIRTAAIEIARTHPMAVVALVHPGTVATPLTEKYAAGRRTVAPSAAATNILGVLDGLTPAESGGFFDWAGKPIPW